MSQKTSLHRDVVEAVAAHLIDASVVVLRPVDRGPPAAIDLAFADARGRVQSIAVRGATVRQRVHTIRRKNVYAYNVTYWAWNLHVHGKRWAQPDWWVLVPDMDVSDALVIPGAELRTARTVALSIGARSSRYCTYRRQWSAIIGQRKAA